MRTRKGKYVFTDGRTANCAHFEDKLRRRWSYLFEGECSPPKLKLNRRAETEHRFRKKGEIDLSVVVQIFTRELNKNKDVIEIRVHTNKSVLLFAEEYIYYKATNTPEKKEHNLDIFWKGIYLFTSRLVRRVFDYNSTEKPSHKNTPTTDDQHAATQKTLKKESNDTQVTSSTYPPTNTKITEDI